MNLPKNTSARSGLIRGGALLSVSEGLCQALRFVRNIICARVLCPDDFGIAATCGLATTLLEMITDLGLERMLVQDKHGDDDRLGATAQSLLLLRGLLIGTLLFALAEPLGVWFKAPQAVSAYRFMALLPILGGLAHRDTVRLQRELRFAPWATCRVVPELAITLLAWPVALWMRSFWAFAILEMLRGSVALTLSHVVSERRYRLGWNREIALRFLSFGWPLLLNGVLMYAAIQGDRIVVGLASQPAELGIYSIAVVLSYTPITLIGNVSLQLLLPFLSRAQDDRIRFDRLQRSCLIVLTALATSFGTMLILAGPWFVRLVYGAKYAAAGAVVGWLGAAQAIRIVRIGSITAALALGDTRNSLISNVFRLVGVGLAVGLTAMGGHLREVAMAAVVGELSALWASIAFLWWRHAVGLAIGWRLAVFLVVVLSLSGIVAMTGSPLLSVTAMALFGLVLPTVLLSFSEELRRVAWDKWTYSLGALREA